MPPLLIGLCVGFLILGFVLGLSVGFCLALKGLLTPKERKLFWEVFWESFRLQWKPRRQGKGR